MCRAARTKRQRRFTALSVSPSEYCRVTERANHWPRSITCRGAAPEPDTITGFRYEALGRLPQMRLTGMFHG